MNSYQLISESLSSNIVTVYHFTAASNIPSIKKHGLVPSFNKLHKKHGLFSIPKYYLHTNIPAIYVSPDDKIDFDNLNNPSYKTRSMKITIHVNINDLYMDEDDITKLYWLSILRNYFNYKKKTSWGFDIDEDIYTKILDKFQTRDYDLNIFNKINHFKVNFSDAEKIQILDCMFSK